MSSYRVICLDGIFYVQEKIGIIFKQWEYLNQYGITLDYDYDWEDAEPARFEDKESAIKFMEESSDPCQKPKDIEVIAWIGDKE